MPPPVAPFQLAYTVVLPCALRASPLGGVSGLPVQVSVNRARWLRSLPGKAALSSTRPAFWYSEKYGWDPHPTRTLPSGSSWVLPVNATSKPVPWRYWWTSVAVSYFVASSRISPWAGPPGWPNVPLLMMAQQLSSKTVRMPARLSEG